MARGNVPDDDGTGREVRVFLLDDHEVVRRGVRDLLETEPGLTVVGEAGTVEQALVRIPALRPDVAVLDMRLPDGDALLDAVMAGASGYVLKHISGTDLVSAVRTVASGQFMPDPGATTRLMARLRDGPKEPETAPDALTGLTEREREILALIGEGLTNRQIGERLYLAEKTVKHHIATQARAAAERPARTAPSGRG